MRKLAIATSIAAATAISATLLAFGPISTVSASPAVPLPVPGLPIPVPDLPSPALPIPSAQS